MKKLLASVSIAALLLPGFAFAASGDVLLAVDTVLSVNGITLNVSGSSTSTIQSIAVGSTSFTVTLVNGSAFQVTAPNLNQLTADNSTWRSVNTCDGSSSVLGYDVEDTVVVTITPSATLCADEAEPAGSSKSDAGGGGGGGATTVVTPPVVPPVVPVVAPVNNAQAVALIKAQLIPLIQQLIVLLTQELQKMQASGNY